MRGDRPAGWPSKSRRVRGLSALLALAAVVALLVPALSTGTAVVNPTVEAKRDTDPVVLTGAGFGAWSVPENVTLLTPLIDLQDCPYYDGSDRNSDPNCDRNNYVKPTFDSADAAKQAEGALPQGTPIDRLLGYRWNGASGRWEQIPFQVDEQYTRYLDNSASGFAIYSGDDEHTTYAYDRPGDREGFRYTKSEKAYDPSDPDKVCQSKAASPPGYDPVKGLDSNDELAFMANDAGAKAPSDAALPAGIEGAKEVTVTDPTNPTAPPTYAYVMKAAANGPKPAFNAENGYVSYKRDANADIFAFSQSSYDTYGAAPKGEYCDDQGHVVKDPQTGKPKIGQRRPRDGATITTRRYKYRYDGRWLMTKVQVSDDGGRTYGRDLVDRWKARAFAQDPASDTPCCGYEEEDTNWGGSSQLLGEHVGPVRAIRETWGADSGTNVIRRETFYRDQMQQRTWLRVHVIPPLDGIYAQWDFNSTAVNRYYNAQLETTTPNGVPVDGRNDEVFGNFDDPCNDNWDKNDTGTIAQTYREAYANAKICDFSQYHQSFDPSDPTFTGANVGLLWNEVAGPAGRIVDRVTASVKNTTPGGAAQSVVAVPYYRDDSCFDDGTGNDPGPKIKKRTADEPQTYGSPPQARACWNNPGPDGDPGGTDEQPNGKFFQGSIGTHGLHLLFLVDSDNARQTKPVDEIVSDWGMVMLPPAKQNEPENVGEQYGRSFERPLVAVAGDFGGGSNQYGNGAQNGGAASGGGSQGGGSSGQQGGAGGQLVQQLLAGRFSHCAEPTGSIHGLFLGPVFLGQTRRAGRSAFPSFDHRRDAVDRACFLDGHHIRIGYMTAGKLAGLSRTRRGRERAVLILTSSPHYKLRGIRPGSRVRTLRRRFHRLRRAKIGRNRWYLARGRRARIVFKTRHGRVQEIGIAKLRPTRTRRGARRFLRSFPG